MGLHMDNFYHVCNIELNQYLYQKLFDSFFILFFIFIHYTDFLSILLSAI